MTDKKDDKKTDVAINVDEKSFDDLLKEKKPVLVDFFATWCGPCQMLSPIIDEVAKEAKGEFVVAKIDIDENPKLSAKYNVMSVPTIVVLKDGKETNRMMGAQTKEALISSVNK